jgi:protein CWC15
MTTAHRPTWNSVKGGSEQGGNVLVQPSRQYSALDMPAHLKLKTRQEGQGNRDEQQIDFKQELLLKEQEVKMLKRGYKEIESEFKEPAPIKRLNMGEGRQAIKTPFP